MNKLLSFCKANFYSLAIITVLLFGFGLRLVHFYSYYSVDQGDVARDYLVAHHMVKYGEFATSGPTNSIFYGIRTSPIYYYFLAIPLLIHDSIYTLGIVNLLLQFVSIIALILIAEIIFGKSVGFVTCILMVFSQQYFSHSAMFWQPHVTVVLVSFSYLYLALGYSYNKKYAVYTSVVLMTASFGFGFYAGVILPLYVFLVLSVLKKYKISLSTYFKLFLTIGLLVFIEFYPYILDLFSYSYIGWAHLPNALVVSFAQFIDRFLEAGDVFIRSVFGGEWLSATVKLWVLRGFFMLGVYYFIFYTSSKKNISKIILYCILQIIFLSSFINKQKYEHFFIAGYGVFYILIAEIIVKSLVAVKKCRFLGYGVVAFAFLVIGVNNVFFRWRWGSVNIPLHLENAVASIVQEIDKDSFNIVTARPNGLFPSEAIFWVPLEKYYNKPLTRVSPYYNNFEPLSKENQTIFLVCMDFLPGDILEDACIPHFLKEYDTYQVLKNIYTDGRYSIFLTKQT